MEIRTLRYFLEIAREKNMTHAAERLHVSQPTLSKQMAALEGELGCSLFIRGRASVSLTEEGMLLRERAEEIVSLAERTDEEFASMGAGSPGGVVGIGCAESHLVGYLGRALQAIRAQAPGVRVRIVSGDSDVAVDRLERGLVDFALIAEMPDLSRYSYLEMPGCDAWGLIMKSDDPLAGKDRINVEDLLEVPLICSEQAMISDLPRWCGETTDKLHFIGFVNLAYLYLEEGRPSHPGGPGVSRCPAG